MRNILPAGVSRLVHMLRTHPEGGPRFLRFGTHEQVLFAKRLSLYLRAGVPIHHALSNLTEDAKGASAAFVYGVLKDSVASGQPLSNGLASLRGTFRDFSISLIAVGEASGTLADCLSHLAAALRKQELLRKKLLAALIYPAIIVCATFGIACFLTIYAFPKIVPLFRGFGTELPLSTRALIALSDTVASYGFILLAAGIGAVIGFWILIRRKRFRQAYEQSLLRIPLFGSLLSAYCLALIARALATLLESGVRLVPAIELASASSRNHAYQTALESVRHSVLQGESLSHAFSSHPDRFPRIFVQMVRAGEETGTLASAFSALADQHEESLDELTRNLTTLIEPALMVTMGLLVGFIALAIITPVYQITRGISG